MRYSLFRKRMKAPPLAEGQRTVGRQQGERLKAGRLAVMAIALTRSLIEQFGPRASGSDANYAVANEIARSLKPFCDQCEESEVDIDPTFHSLPLALMAYLYPFVLLFLLFRLPLLALILVCLYGAYLVRTLYYYRPAFRNKRATVKGINVHGIIEPQGQVKKTVIFSAHHDSARLFRHNRLNRLSYMLTVGVPIALFCLAGILSILLLFTAQSIGLTVMIVLMLALSPRFLALIRFYDDAASPGGGDNLNGVAMVIQLARYFNWKRLGSEGLGSTRLIFCSFDGEEVGLQGSTAWYERHRELASGAIVLNFDAVYRADALTFLERDINGTQKLDHALARRCVDIAHSMGWKARSESIPRLGGATDAAPAQKAGALATTLTAVFWGDHSQPAVYHTTADTVDAIEEEAVERAISIAIRLVELVDSDSLWDVSETEIPPDEPEQPSLSFSKLTYR